jgi:hypothetical protein
MRGSVQFFPSPDEYSLALRRSREEIFTFRGLSMQFTFSCRAKESYFAITGIEFEARYCGKRIVNDNFNNCEEAKKLGVMSLHIQSDLQDS